MSKRKLRKKNGAKIVNMPLIVSRQLLINRIRLAVFQILISVFFYTIDSNSINDSIILYFRNNYRDTELLL